MTDGGAMDGQLSLFVRGSDTSEAAAESVARDAPRLRELVLSTIRAAGDYGMTCDEIEATLNMRHQTISARVYELHKREQIVDSAARRLTRSGRAATVWVAA